MSGKGSKRRPGEGYADNWDRIFGKKKQEPVEVEEANLDPSKTYRRELSSDGRVTWWEVDPPQAGYSD